MNIAKEQITIFSPYLKDKADFENRLLEKQLRNHLLGNNIPFETVETCLGPVYVIYDLSISDGIALAKEYGVESVIYRDCSKYNEVCVTSFEDLRGNKHSEGELLRTFPKAEVLRYRNCDIF